MTKKRKKPAHKIAMHEAGHAVVALAVGYVVGNVWIDPDDELGQTDTAWILGDGTGEDPMCAGIVAWAGSVAEGVGSMNEHDAEPLQRHRFSKRSVATLRTIATAILGQFGPAVHAVAQALVAKRKLSGAEVKRIACKACPELRRECTPVPREVALVMRTLGEASQEPLNVEVVA